MQIYKRNQGKYTRVISAVAGVILSGWGCYALVRKLGGSIDKPLLGVDAIYWQFGIPVLLLVGLLLLIFWLVNRPRNADFLIATEGEMKKVSWSSRKEVIGSTKVVIVTTFIMAALLFLVDFLFANLFRLINVTG
jgi:preprotein translocase subunit SecE